MDKKTFEIIEKLLDQWQKLLKLNAKASLEKASLLKGGLNKRIKLDGKAIVFDYPTTKIQNQIQKQLLKLLPEHESLIMSEPAILDFDWKTEDYLELYAGHYAIVVTKLLETIEKMKCQTNLI